MNRTVFHDNCFSRFPRTMQEATRNPYETCNFDDEKNITGIVFWAVCGLGFVVAIVVGVLA